MVLHVRRECSLFQLARSFKKRKCAIQYPDKATFLTEPERAWLVETLKNDTLGLSRQFKRKFVFQALRDPHIWLLFGIHFW